MASDYLTEMRDYWEHRYAAEGMIWGAAPGSGARLARELFAPEQGGRLLVPGAGYGRHSRFFSEHGFSITAVETAAAAVRLAARHDPGTAYVHASLLEADLPAESFDCIYGASVLHLFREKERALFLQKCFSLLRSDGVLFFTVFSDQDQGFGRGGMVEANTFESKPGRPVHYFTEEDLLRTFSGFTVIRTGLLKEEENHGPEGPHTHLLRFVYARKAALDFDARRYREHSQHTKGWGARAVSELRLTGDENVLDLGCGEGVITSRLAALVPRGRVLGIDSSRNMIDEARKLAKDNLHFRRQDIADLDYREEFDLIFSNAALHWVTDHGTLAERCYAALKAGGRLRFNFGAQGNCPDLIAVTRKLMAAAEFAPYFRDFTWPWYMPPAAEYQEIMSRFPYRGVRIWAENADTWFPTLDELVGWIDQPSLVPFLKHLPQDIRSRFRDLVVQRMISLTRQDDGRYREPFRRLNVLAVK